MAEQTSMPVASLDFESLLNDILNQVQEVIPCSHATIALLNENKTGLVAHRTVGGGPQEGRLIVPIDKGVIGWVARTGLSANIPDVSKDDRYYSYDSTTRSEVAAPILLDDEVLGVINVESQELDAFNKTHMMLLSALADQAAMTIRTAHLYSDLEQSFTALASAYNELSVRNEISQLATDTLKLERVLPGMLINLKDLANASHGLITLWDSGTRKVYQIVQADSTGAHYVPVPERDQTPTGVVVEGMEPIILRDLSGYRFVPSLPVDTLNSAIGIPLMARSHAIGALFLFREEGKRPFTPHDIDRLRAVIYHVALAVDNHILLTDIQHRLRETGLLQTIAHKASTTLDVDTLLDSIAPLIVEYLDAPIFQAWLVDPISDQLALHTESAIGMMQSGEPPAFSVDDDGIISTVYRINTTFMTNDLPNDPRLANPETMVAQMRIKRAIAVPIFSRHRSSGVLIVANRNGTFVDDHLKLMTAIGGQIGIAISNAQLYISERKRATLMQQINRISSELTAVLDVSELFYRVVISIQRILKYEATYLLLRRGSELRLRAKSTAKTTRVLDEDEVALPVTQGAAGRAVRTERSYIVRDLSLDPDPYPPDTEIGPQAELAVPIRSGHTVIGVLDILSSRLGAFEETDREAIETLATQVAIAIENARLYEETQKRLKEQEIVHQISRDLNAILDIPRLADATVYQMAHALGTTGCIFGLYNVESDMLAIRALYVGPDANNKEALSDFPWREPLGNMPSSFRTMLLMRNPLLLDVDALEEKTEEYQLLEEYDQKAALFVPLIAANRPLGLIAWMDDREPRRFTASEVRLAQTLANQAAVALERARLHEETQRQLKREMLLRRIAETANNWLDQEAMLDDFVQEVCRALQASVCGIYDIKDELLICVRQHVTLGANTPIDGKASIPLGDFPAIRAAMDSGEVLRISVSDPADGEEERVRLREQGYMSMMLAPLISRGRLVGALQVMDDRTNRIFTDTDADLLDALANQISIAVDNADLFSELESRAAELEEANRLKSEFLANISHELRTPMNSIIGFTGGLQSGIYGELTEMQLNRLGKVSKNASSLLELINDLLDISKIEAGHIELVDGRVDINTTLDAVCAAVEPQINEKSLYLAQSYPDNLPDVQGDAHRLRQIFTNIISNAIKFTEEGGVTVDAFEEDDHIHVTISDTGIGISSEDQAIIFDEFRQADGSSTRQYEGTGLGLAISRKLIDIMNGSIWVESEIGKGSVFHLTIPTMQE